MQVRFFPQPGRGLATSADRCLRSQADFQRRVRGGSAGLSWPPRAQLCVVSVRPPCWWLLAATHRCPGATELMASPRPLWVWLCFKHVMSRPQTRGSACSCLLPEGPGDWRLHGWASLGRGWGRGKGGPEDAAWGAAPGQCRVPCYCQTKVARCSRPASRPASHSPPPMTAFPPGAARGVER